jgi:type II secretory pathway component PulF
MILSRSFTTMDTQKLKTALAQLHGELASGGKLDPELAQQLRALDQDIQTALAASEQQDDLVANLNERTQAIDARFSADHPYLSSALRDVMDTLGKMGI